MALILTPVTLVLINGGPKWARTTDTRVINTVLYQLSYGPKVLNLLCNNPWQRREWYNLDLVRVRLFC